MKLRPISLNALFLLLAPAALWGQAPLVLKLPPSQVNVVAQGMGNAVAADGTLFNATSFNPALLNRTPHGVEAFVLGVNVSNDLPGIIDYAQNLKTDNDQIYQQLAYGINNTDSVSINAGLSSIDDEINHLTNKALQAGAGANIAVKIDKHWGFQVYNSTHAFSQLWRGNLTNALLAVPLDSNSANSAAVSTAVTIMGGDIQTGINQVLTSDQQSQVSGDIAALKNGSESVTQFAQNVSTTLGSVDPHALEQAILNSLLNDIAVLTALVYSDTVIMGTYDFQPFEKQVPGLTVGGNLKLVNRRFAYEAFSFKDNSGAGQEFTDSLKQTTTRWGFDFGALYEMPDLPLDFGLAVNDLFHSSATIVLPAGSLASNFLTDPAPTMVSLSTSWHPAPGLRVNGEVDDLFSSSTLYVGNASASRIKLGASYSALGFLNLRTGFGDQNLSAGLGLTAGFFGLDYSYGVDELSQAYNHYAQVKFVF